MRAAADSAPIVWDMMEDVLADVLNSRPDVRDALRGVKSVTAHLRRNIRAEQRGDGTVNKKMLRDDAHVFIKVRRIVM